MQLLVLGPDGTPVDTLAEPSSPSQTPFGPYSPSFQWTFHPSGHFLTGMPSEYRIDLARDDGVLRIERAAEPVPVLEEEGAYEQELFSRGMREFNPDGAARRYRSRSRSSWHSWPAGTDASG